MRRRTSPRPAQLVLDLKRETKELPIPQDATVLLQALADLLLGALGELIEKTDKDLLGCNNFGQTSLTEVKRRLEEFGLKLIKGDAE